MIDSLGNLGEGVGRVNGWVVFVPYALPGERVRVRIWRNKAHYSDADLVAVLEPAAERVEPQCPLFGACGGCQYQHFAYPGQLRWKTRQIGELLRKMAGIEVEPRPCVGSPVIYGYRTKITPHCRTDPTDPATPIGFERAHSRALIDVPACPIATPAINAALPAARAALRGGTGGPATAGGYADSAPGGARAGVRGRRGSTLLLRETAAGVVSDMRAVVEERVGEQVFQFVAGEFFQNNPFVLPLLLDWALAEAAADGIGHLVDAYCGVGVFAIRGHHLFRSVCGIEVNPAAVLRARHNAARNGAGNCRFIEGAAEQVFAGLDHAPAASAVLLDPPRKGCAAEFIAGLLAWRPRRIVYVSCAPDTQARDLRLLLAGGYTIRSVQPFDLFPHTRHIENVVSLDG